MLFPRIWSRQLFTTAVFILVTLFQPSDRLVHARFTATWAPGNSTSYPSMDYYNHRTPYYSLAGTIVTWSLDGNSTACEYPPVNDAIRRYFKNTRESMAQKQDSAMMIFWSDAMNANCNTIAQAALAAERFSKDVLEKAGYPPLGLLVFAAHAAGKLPLWGPKMLPLRSVDPSVPDGPPNVPALFLDGKETSAIYPYIVEKNQERNIILSFAATQESGPWNDIYLSDGFLALIWVLTTVLVIATLYAIARVLRLNSLGQLSNDIRLPIVVLSVVCSMASIANFFLTSSTLVGRCFSIIANLLSVLVFDMLLWHWSVRGRNVFSRPLVIAFRMTIICHVLLYFCHLGFDIYLASSWLKGSKATISMVYKRYIQPFVFLFGAVVFAAFGAWFIRAIYQLRNHSKARLRFIQLSTFSFLASATFSITSTKAMITGSGDQTVTDYTVGQIVFFDVSDMIILSVRSLVCLGVLGVTWPRPSQDIITSAKGMRAPGWSTRMWRHLNSIMSTKHSSRGGNTTGNITGMTSIQSPNRAQYNPRANLLGEETTIGINTMGASILMKLQAVDECDTSLDAEG
ncbi:hypothetical protein THASP1DRAFT_30131 [Thamnocephalis sphaerospora]|uniref:Uncharacterized protein n=1 Tax=Thamnocephalis sphaerospora TaxID=78915 RepID=A0A4P9XPX6_9FUNG|nr:hypothetical protein THASP1DRAFT_30131 [Thamnocephalis sphaerospora]|eukprot:RKP08066.1 hypothetical protein THASP1DRAFT_30131 [Thamnocephalis sphaerospora]